MGTLWKIAWRNVLRNKRRTAITAIVMTVGIGLFIMMDSMLVGMDRLTLDNMVDYTESLIKIRTPEYVDNIQGTPLEYGIPDPEAAMRSVLASDGRVSAVAPRAHFVATVSNYEDSLPVLATVVDPVRDGKVLNLPEAIVEGSWLKPGENGTIAIGVGLAAQMGLGVGDYLIISASTVYDNINADEYRIGGLISCPMPDINNGGLFMSFADADRLLGTEGFVSEIIVASGRMPNIKMMLGSSEDMASTISTTLPGLKVDPLGELARDYLAMRAMKGKAGYFMIMVVLLIAGVGIVNTILMSVYARIREIGVLKAYGMSPNEIKRLFTLEGIIVGLLGSAAGTLFGVVLVWLMASKGISVAAMVGDIDMGGLPLNGTLYGEWNPATMVIGFIFGVLVSFIAARIPAKRAAKMEVTDALRFA